jgi:hypothetical protein
VSAGAGQVDSRVAGHGSGHVELGTKSRRKLHRRVRARGRSSGCEISAVDSS